MSELSDLRIAMTNAVESAMRNYLMEHAGEDLPEGQELLDEYKFDVVRVNDRDLTICVKHYSDTRWPYQFNVKVTAVKVRTAP